MRRSPAGLAASLILVLAGCAPVAQIRIHNVSRLDFTEVSVAGQPYGAIAAGATSGYRKVDLRLGYAAIELKADSRYITGQTLNLASRRFTYEIDIENLAARHLAIQVIRE